jgi:two-component system KDP operon response regulator KdpE
MEVFEAATLERGLIEAGSRRPELVSSTSACPTATASTSSATCAPGRRPDHRAVSAQRRRATRWRAGRRRRRLSDQALRHWPNCWRARAPTCGACAPAARHPDATFRFGDVEVDLARAGREEADVDVHLTPIEYRLLGVLIANAGRVLTHPYLLREVWGPSHAQSTHYLRVYMGNLRQKLEDDPAQPRHIVTETGVGYRRCISCSRPWSAGRSPTAPCTGHAAGRACALRQQPPRAT